MKNLIALSLILTSSLSTIAAPTDVKSVDVPTPNALSIYAWQQPTGAYKIMSTQLVDKETKASVDRSNCGSDDSDSACVVRTPLEHRQLIEVVVRYEIAPTSPSDGNASDIVDEKLYLEPSSVPASTLAVLADGKFKKMDIAQGLFQMGSPSRDMVQIKVFDPSRSNICMGDLCSGSNDVIAFKQGQTEVLTIPLLAKPAVQ